jgi:hypothetical protein
MFEMRRHGEVLGGSPRLISLAASHLRNCCTWSTSGSVKGFLVGA